MTRARRDGSSLSLTDQVAITAREYGADLDPSVLALTLTLYRATAVFDRAHSAELAPHRITLRQFNILTVLKRADGALTMAELGAAVAVRPGNLTGVVDSLRQRGFVDCELNPDDRRSFLVSITDDGQEFLASFLPGHWKHLQRLTAGLTLEERETLVRLHDKLATSVHDAIRTAAAENGGPSVPHT